MWLLGIISGKPLGSWNTSLYACSNSSSQFPLCALVVNNFPFLLRWYLLSLHMKYAFCMYIYGLPITTRHTSRGTTSSSSSSVKSTLIENLILHYLVTFISTSLFTHTNVLRSNLSPLVTVLVTPRCHTLEDTFTDL